ncbi:unnamed protein product [Caenorhabditis bovis]|uniref:Uncharacterized protein n=1 Tax=Caenorhabditis bovis TaxID=2654633 RepID=A0A8S1F0U5_9PELO|nr:unnamed protein product [Caenorhabditis bovis]
MKLQFASVYNCPIVYANHCHVIKMLILLEMCAILANMLMFGITIYALRKATFHYNLVRIGIFMMAGYYTLMAGRIVTCVFEIGIIRQDDPEHSMVLIIASYLQYYYFGCACVISSAFAAERYFATRYVAIYEKQKMVWVIYVVCSLVAILAMICAILMQFEIVRILYMTIFGLTLSISSFFFFIILYYMNIRRLQQVQEVNESYTLSIRFQLNENIVTMSVDVDASSRYEALTNLLSNDNRFWTTKFHKVPCSMEKCNILNITSVDTIFASIESPVINLDEFFLRSLFSFAHELYNNIALNELKSKIPEELPNEWNDLMISGNLEAKLDESEKYSFILFFNRFEDFEAIVHVVDAARRTKKNVGIVNCKIYTPICDSFDVTGEPLLIAFENRERYQKFSGEFQENQVFDWILTIEQPDVTKLNEAAVPYYRSGLIPGFEEARDTVTMLFVSTKKSTTYQNWKKIARENHGRFHLAAFVSQDVEKWAHQPALITMKPRDEFIKAFTLHTDLSYARIVDYLEEGVHPSLHPLSSSRQFSYALSSCEKPLIIFFDPLKSRDSTEFRKTASNHQMVHPRTARFSLIQGWDLFGLFIANYFGVGPEQYLIVSKMCDANEPTYCLRSSKIEENNEHEILQLINKKECESTIQSHQLPLDRIAQFERREDVDDLFDEHSTNDGNIHEEL